MNDDANRDDRSLALANEIHRICREHEERWKSGKEPLIEDCLSQVAVDARFDLLRELVAQEAELKCAGTDCVDIDEYRRRFPNDLDAIQAAFNLLDSTEITDDGERSLKSTVQHHSEAASQRASDATGDGDSLTTVQHFRIKAKHARGGLGQVSVAIDEDLNREVAFKEIQEQFADNTESQSRFLLEAEITGGLEHPGIVPVYQLGRHENGRPYYTMRFVRGKNLGDAVKQFHEAEQTRRDQGQRSLELRKLLGQFIRVCNAVEYAHSRGILHRDLKPSNVMLGNYGETLVVDWGLAKSIDLGPRADSSEEILQAKSPHDATAVGSVVGTPAYMSPEQASGNIDSLGPASDIYSLGATLYTLLTGEAPFDSKSTSKEELLARVQQGKFRNPRDVSSSVPRPLEAICLKAMATDPKERYASATKLAEEIERWLADERPTVYREPLLERAMRLGRKHRGVTSIGVLALLALVAVGVFWRLNVTGVRAKTAQQTTSSVSIESAEGQIAVRDWRDAGRFIEEAINATPDRAKAYYLRGRVREETGEIESAEDDFDRAIRLAPDDSRAYFHRGTFFSRQARLDEAERDFAHAVELDAENALAYVNWGNVARERERVDDALAKYGQALRIDPESQRAYSGRAVLYQEQGQTNEALRDFNKGLNIAPDDPELLTNRAKLLTDLGRLEEARQDLDRAIRANPRFANAYNSRGHVLLLKARPDEAIADYSTAIELDPQFALAYGNRASARQKSGQREAALADYNQAIAIDPYLASAYAGRAGTLRQLGKLDDALADCNRSLELKDSDVAYMNRGNVYKSMGKVQEAFGDYEEALRLNAESADTFLNRGVLFYATNKLEEAVSDYSKAISLDPQDALAHINRGNALKDLGQHNEALVDYNRAIRLAPNSDNAYFNRAVLHLDQRRFAEAINDLNEAIELAPTIARYYKARADAFDRLRKDQLASQDYDKAVEIDPGFVDAYINRAELLVDSDIQRSLSDIQEALRLAPDNPTVLMNIGAILDRSNRFEEAEQYLTEAIRLDGNSALALANRALTRLHLRKYDEALEDFEKSLELENDPETLRNRAGLHFERQDFQKAIDDYSEALAIAPRSFAPALYAQRATVYAQIGENESAVEDCEKALEIDPNLALALIIRASARTNLNDPLRALEDFSMALQIGGDPRLMAMLYHNRGFLLHQIGDMRGALDDFDRAIALSPNSAQALNARADLYVEQGDYEDAVADIENAIVLRPNVSNLHNTRGRVLRHLERYTEAIDAYSEAIRLNPNSATAYGNRGELHQALKENAQALADYNQCLELAPDDGGFMLNRANLHRAEGRFDAALADAEAALSANAELAFRYYAVKANIYLAQGKHAEAVESFTTNLIERPAQSRGYLYRAEAEMKLKKFELALRDAETARRRGLDDADDIYRLASLFARLHETVPPLEDQKREPLLTQSLEVLSRAVDNGFNDADLVAEDAVWDSLRSHPDFIEAIDRLKNQDSPDPPTNRVDSALPADQDDGA